ncbi:MAG: universal stress protein [Boseongicola sp. SB0675_bin_26]|nr:universal stress protein [Boseongicola sp. SB0675_bin_26]
MPECALHTIMLPVRGDGKGRNVLAHAAVLARRFGAHVRIVHCHPTPEDMMPYGVVMPSVLRKQIEEAAGRNADVTRTQLATEFQTLANEFGLKDADPQPGTATARFIEFEGKQVDAVRHYGRVADLICVPQPEGARLGANTLKSALFSSGRPVMMCPDTDSADDRLGFHVAIAWNGSIEASRAVGLAMPIIANAESVTIMSSGSTDHPASSDELRCYLESKGISSAIRRFEARGSIVGDQLLTEARSADADMLVMGAYHESYERETIFGGNSQVVVAKADLPVVLVH